MEIFGRVLKGCKLLELAIFPHSLNSTTAREVRIRSLNRIFSYSPPNNERYQSHDYTNIIECHCPITVFLMTAKRQRAQEKETGFELSQP